MLGEAQLKRETSRMKETGKIDGLIGGKEIGKIIDHHNNLVDKKKEDEYNSEMTARNKYYWKLWKNAIEEKRGGTGSTRNVFRLKPSPLLKGGV